MYDNVQCTMCGGCRVKSGCGGKERTNGGERANEGVARTGSMIDKKRNVPCD